MDPDGLSARREQFIEQFAAEAKTIARLDHPSIVQVFDFGSADMPSGGPAAVMVLEWLSGKTLQDALVERRGRGGRTLVEALGLLRDVIEAVASAHEACVAHRDLKPANIILVTAHRGPPVRLLDFGIAKVMSLDEVAGGGHTHTRSSQSSFSAHYASPEPLTSARTGPWTDVHALGLIVTELRTDRAPYVGQSLAALFASVPLRRAGRPLRRRHQRLRPDLPGVGGHRPLPPLLTSPSRARRRAPPGRSIATSTPRTRSAGSPRSSRAPPTGSSSPRSRRGGAVGGGRWTLTPAGGPPRTPGPAR